MNWRKRIAGWCLLGRLGLAATLFLTVGTNSGAAPKAPPRLVRSGLHHGGDAPEKLILDVSGSQALVLVTLSRTHHKAIWGDAVLLAADGQITRLSDLKPEVARLGATRMLVNQGPLKQPLQAGERKFTHGLCVDSQSLLVFPLKGKYTRFEVWAGLSHLMSKTASASFQVCDKDYYDVCQLAAEVKRGFTPAAFSFLRQELETLQERGSGKAERGQVLRLELERFTSQAAALRQAWERDPVPHRDQLQNFKNLVREIHLARLDAPLLFTTRHPIPSPHIYDECFHGQPGGGIYVLEYPAAPPAKQVVRAVVDATTPGSPGPGIYRDPELSWDGQRVLFAFKGPDSNTCIYEVGVDGSGLRQLTRHSAPAGTAPSGRIGQGQHDLSPCYLPDGRIAFLSTRGRGLVMCFNCPLTTLHTMNADGSDLKAISVNNASEFDPVMLPDGRLLYGRWEYIDKSAYYPQGLWTVYPDGSSESALFANNLARPASLLDARPVPGSALIAATLGPHNGNPLGAIAMIDPTRGKNNPAAIFNFTPEYPTKSDEPLESGPCDPWPISENMVLISHQSDDLGSEAAIELVDRFGNRTVVHRAPQLSCYSPMLVQPRPVPAMRSPIVQAGEPARFFLDDVYRGLDNVPRGAVKSLRAIETTTRVSGVPKDGRWWNQSFLVSWQGSYDVKRFLGTIPVEPDGSAYFEVPPGRAIYFQALDSEGRLLQSMRTFVQGVPGVTRSCTGCHVADEDAAPSTTGYAPLALKRAPSGLTAESWGGGLLDYSRQVQPVLDRHCVSCHGGPRDIAGGLDLSGGWTWAFNLSYESLLKNTLTGFLNCENDATATVGILPPRTHGSGVAPLTRVLLSHHDGKISPLPRPEVDLLLAWMDGNCNYYGTYNFTETATCDSILSLRDRLVVEMNKAGCVKCHEKSIGSDWINLQMPEWSRILRAPLAKAGPGWGLAWCRNRPAKARLPLVNQELKPPDVLRPAKTPPLDLSGKVKTTFASVNDPAYQRMLTAIVQARTEALKNPRVDMPGARIIQGECR